MPEPRTKGTEPTSYLEKLETDLRSNQSKLSLILGALIVLVVGVLIFNYFSRGRGSQVEVGPAQKTEEQADVSPENLPGKYTVKEGDTLFLIAQKYYKEGNQFLSIAKANNIQNIDNIEVGQVLEIPKLEGAISSQPQDTQWGPAIRDDTYTIVEGDWLSKVATRAYGDKLAYPKIAQANNIQNPDLIYPGQVLKIPR